MRRKKILMQRCRNFGMENKEEKEEVEETRVNIVE